MNKSVFVVEDDALTATLLEQYIEEMGYQFVGKADTAKTALQKIRLIHPDLVLMDIKLKGKMDGIEVSTQLRDSEIPVIYLTAYADENLMARAKLTEPYGYLVKPFTKLGLRASIEMAFYKSDMERQQRELLNHIRRLEGLLSICMNCKKIRTESNDWQQLEHYLSEHSDAVFSHGLCPTCFASEMKTLA